MKWTMEQKAYVAEEWARGGTSQKMIGERYGYTVTTICNRISEFIIEIFPDIAQPGHSVYGRPPRMFLSGNVSTERRRELVKKALVAWGGQLTEPPYSRGDGPADMWPEFVLPLDNTPDIAA